MFNKLLFCNSRLGLRSRDCPSRSEIALEGRFGSAFPPKGGNGKDFGTASNCRESITSLLRKLIEFSRSYLNEQLYRTKDRGRVWGIYLWLAAAGKGIRGGRATFPESRA